MKNLVAFWIKNNLMLKNKNMKNKITREVFILISFILICVITMILRHYHYQHRFLFSIFYYSSIVGVFLLFEKKNWFKN